MICNCHNFFFRKINIFYIIWICFDYLTLSNDWISTVMEISNPQSMTKICGKAHELSFILTVYNSQMNFQKLLIKYFFCRSIHIFGIVKREFVSSSRLSNKHWIITYWKNIKSYSYFEIIDKHHRSFLCKYRFLTYLSDYCFHNLSISICFFKNSSFTVKIG
jgi:hypothetical protein